MAGPVAAGWFIDGNIRRTFGEIQEIFLVMWATVTPRAHNPGVLCYERVMDREDIIARLRENEAAPRSRGVMHAALFGARGRGDAHPRSDTDIMIEIDPSAHIGVWGYAGLRKYISTLFDGPVDVVDREALKPYVADRGRDLCLLTRGSAALAQRQLLSHCRGTDFYSGMRICAATCAQPRLTGCLEVILKRRGYQD
jgi:predicted nucleotidyltransferase